MAAPVLAPKRQRGRLRVEAIMQAAIALFGERGFDGTTMTEIAAQSGTAIGSLYRFFPTKESLADVLLRDYAEDLTARLGVVARDAAHLDSKALAQRLIDEMAHRGVDREALSVLADVRRDGPYSRSIIRQVFYDALAGVLSGMEPGMAGQRLDRAVRILRQLLKGASAILAEETDEAVPDLAIDWRALVADYLQRVRAAAD